ncbi:MAG TPA: hypothetical protein VLG44_02980, partial [Chlamydiales bacterium]|nr:hypothetical protein [Chlamydiales bacterium]
IKESLGWLTRFIDWFCGRQRKWVEFDTNLGKVNIDVQDDSINNLIVRATVVYTAAIGSTARPAAPVLPSSSIHDQLHNACQAYMAAKSNPAIAKDLLNRIRNLMAQGADPFRLSCVKQTSFHIAGKDLDLVKVLTRTENVKAFEHCKNIHDFWDVIYEPSTEELPRGWEAWIKLLPQSSLTERLQLAIKAEEIEAMPSLDKIIPELEKVEKSLGRKLSAGEILDHLMRYSSIEITWKQFGSNPPKIVDAPSSFFADSRVHRKGLGACYNSHTHTIFIEETGTLAQKIYGLGFEVMNALQQKGFTQLISLMNSRETRLPRECFAFLIEYTEFDSGQGLRLLAPKGALENRDIRECWIVQNMVLGDGLVSHTTPYRMRWDEYYSWDYVCTHRAEFQDKLKKLCQA